MSRELIKKAFRLGYSVGMKKTAGPSLRERAWARVPGAAERLAEQQNRVLTDSAGRVYRPGMRVLGHGSNRAFATPDELRRISRERDEFREAHPGQYYASLAAPLIAGAGGAAAVGGAVTAPSWAPVAGKSLVSGATSAGRALASAGRTAAPYAKAFWRNWRTPGFSLMESASKPVSLLGKAYNYVLPNVQKFGPLAMAALDDKKLEKMPNWVKALPAYTQLLSPSGLATGAAYNVLGRLAGKKPDVASGLGGRAARAAANIVDNGFVNKRVPLLPSLFGWSPSAAKNFNSGFVDELAHNSKIEDVATSAAKNVYDAFEDKAPEPVRIAMNTRLPKGAIEDKVRGFFKLPLDKQREMLKGIPVETYDKYNGALARYIPDIPADADYVPDWARERWNSMSPAERAAFLTQTARAGYNAGKATSAKIRGRGQTTLPIPENSVSESVRQYRAARASGDNERAEAAKRQLSSYYSSLESEEDKQRFRDFVRKRYGLS